MKSRAAWVEPAGVGSPNWKPVESRKLSQQRQQGIFFFQDLHKTAASPVPRIIPPLSTAICIQPSPSPCLPTHSSWPCWPALPSGPTGKEGPGLRTRIGRWEDRILHLRPWGRRRPLPLAWRQLRWRPPVRLPRGRPPNCCRPPMHLPRPFPLQHRWRSYGHQR